MDIGISTFLTDYSVDVATIARRIEELGFDSLWVPEHPIIPVTTASPWPGSPDGVIPKVYADIVDPFVALARASAVTTTLKLATGIVLVPERHPVLLAKEVATLDMYSGGRFLFGIGARLEPGGERDSWRRLRSPLVPGAGVCPGNEGALDQGRERVPWQVLRLPAGVLVPAAGPAAAPARAAGRHGAQRLPPSRGLRRRLAAQPCHAGGRGEGPGHAGRAGVRRGPRTRSLYR